MSIDSSHSLYSTAETALDVERHVIAVIVDNEFGVLSRVIGLFSSRGYNIQSLTVSEIDKDNSISRITIITTASDKIIEQIISLLNRLVPVREVHNLTLESPHIERGIALLKVLTTDANRQNAQQIADRFGARTIDSTEKSFIFELTDVPAKLDKFIDLMRPCGVAEISRTGATAISRGEQILETKVNY